MSTIKVNRFENFNGIGYGTVLQTLNYSTAAYAACATAIPVDNTIPQIAEGVSVLSLAITPKSATNKLKIVVHVHASHSVGSTMVIALFQDSTASALCASSENVATANTTRALNFTYYMDAGTILNTTFSVRLGAAAAATTYFNGASAAQLFGGVYFSSITIEEIQI